MWKQTRETENGSQGSTRYNSVNLSQCCTRRREPNRAIGVYSAGSTPLYKENAMKGIVAYFLGIPIVIIILLYVTGIF